MVAGRQFLTIGKLAREAGVSVETVRYYQRRGLLDLPLRPVGGGFRHYTERDIALIRFIKHSQQMGFTLAEITELVPHIDSSNCRATKTLVESKLKTVETQLADLQKIHATLKSLITECERECRGMPCPLKLKFHGMHHDSAAPRTIKMPFEEE